MRKALLVFVSSFFLFNGYVSAQDDVLFSVGDTKVKKSEFEYIYKKNNFSNKADYSQKSLDDYLNLYVNFRLKVKEALEQKLDQNDRFKDELASYEKQLLDSYVDKDILEKLVKEEYERSKTDVTISHIFFPASSDGDMTGALAKATEAYKKIKAGAAFEDLVKSSQDKKTADKGGKLGWFNSYQIALPEIEEMIYSMKTGDVSEPVKTRLGYHILKLNETRAARPKLKVAIIKRFFPITDTSAQGRKVEEDTVQMAYTALKNNTAFDKAVLQYSQDESTKSNQGKLDWFGINTYAKVFEDVAYSLKDGEYSQPFKTTTAWYIVKRLETAAPQSYEDAVPVLKIKLPTLPQFQYELDKYIDKLKDKLAVKEFTENYPILKQRLMVFAQMAPFTYKDTTKPKTLLQIGKKMYNENDFGKQIQETFYTVYPKPGIDKYDALLKNTVQNMILEYYKNEIRENNQEYKSLMEEYKNGIMIFSLSEKNIWDKASDDSAGLITYYNQHKADFNLKRHATLRTIYTNDEKQAKALYKIIAADKGVTDAMLTSKLKSLGITEPKITTQVVDAGKTKISLAAESLSLPVADGNKFQITQVYNIQPEKVRAFQECRGYVVAAYQEYLEKQWIEQLKVKYPVAIHKEVLDGMVKK